MSDIIRRIQKKFRRVRHSKTKIMNGKGNARKLITPNKKTKGPTLWDRLLAAAPRAKVMIMSGTALLLAGATIGTTFAIRGCSSEDKARMAYAVEEAESGITSILHVEPTPTPSPTPEPLPTPEPILHRGITSERVIPLQERLMELGYMDSDTPTDFFGPATEHGVELFQRQVSFTEAIGIKLDMDGWAGEQTLSILMSDSAPKYCVKEGMEGEDVSQMQKQLVDMGYMRKTTGYYGDETKAAMKDFQSRNGLSADGLAGEKTYDMLYSPKAKESPKKAAQKKTKANISKMIEVARSKLGCKYILGNTGPKSFDCSGLVYYCLKQAGSNRRRLTAAGYSQVDDWEKISDINKLKKGDLICFYSDNYSKIGHIGIVISSSMMIDASSSNGKVVRREYKTTYWKKHFYCGRRPW